MIRLADGDREAFDEVYRLAHQPILALCRKLLSGHQDAEDLAQDALVRVFSGASRYDPERGPALPYLLGGASYAVRSHRKTMARQRLRERSVEHAEGHVVDDGADPLERMLDQELLAAVREVAQQLSPTDQQALLSIAAGGLSPTLRKRLSRAVGRLRTQWSLHWT